MTICKSFLMAVAMVGACAGAAQAQTEPSSTLAWVDGWSLTPLVDRGNGATVTSILALRSPGGATGQNITAVWYIRDDKVPSQWTGKAWSGDNEWEAIQWVKDAIAIPDCFDNAWATFTPKVTVNVTTAPLDYVKGFIADDPLLETVEASPDRDSIVESLTEFGYMVADIPLDYKDGLSDSEDRTELVLSAIAAAVTLQENVPVIGDEVFNAEFQAQFQKSFALINICYPLSFTVPQAWSGWTTGGWALGQCVGTGFCCYDMQVCRTRTIIEYTVTLSCDVGVSNTWQEQECWTHTGSCPKLAQGACPAAPSCNLAVPQTPGNAPPPGVCPNRQRI